MEDKKRFSEVLAYFIQIANFLTSAKLGKRKDQIFTNSITLLQPVFRPSMIHTLGTTDLKDLITKTPNKLNVYFKRESKYH